MKHRFVLLVLSLLIAGKSLCQTSFHYARKISGVNEAAWHEVNLPSDVFTNINENYSDLRIFKISQHDTIEVPYLVRVMEASATSETVAFKQLNKSTRDGNLFVTFELPKAQTIDQVRFNFAERNFDVVVKLEGSHDQREWFSMIERERIAALDKNGIQFNYSDVLFPAANYRYLRATISGTPITFVDASFESTKRIAGHHHAIIHQWSSTDSKAEHQTVVDIKLQHHEPINFINLDFEHHADFYRNYLLEILTDSVKTEKGYRYHYKTVSSGFVTSIKSNNISFELSTTRRLKLTIYNEDNTPLKIREIDARRPVIKLVAQLVPNNDYFLLYGNQSIASPSYDIVHFEENIPDSLSTALLEKEIIIKKEATETTHPLFQSPLWLWSIMGLMIGLLGYFTLRMMKNK